MTHKNFTALSFYFNGKANQLLSDVGIATPFNSQDSQNIQPVIKNFKAIWDTGATNTCITNNVVTALQLQPIGKIMSHTANGVRECNQYLVSAHLLPSKVVLPMVRVTECDLLTGGSDILVGMDIIGIGDFAVTHADGKTTVSYRVPSIKTIDYVVEANNIIAQQPQHTSKPRQQILAKRKKEKRNKKKAKNKKR